MSTEPRDLARAAVDGWDDPMPLEVFADWLEERGAMPRAALLRAAAAWLRDRVGDADSEFSPATHRLWKQARPDWWTRLPVGGLVCLVYRGLARFQTRTQPATAHLGKIAWLPRAIEEGWTASVAVQVAGESTARTLAGPGPLATLPLAALVQSRNPAALDRILDRPHLIRLALVQPGLTAARARRLADHAEVRSVNIPWQAVPTDDRPAVAAAIGRMAGLRELRIRDADALTDADLAPFAALTGLGRLTILRGHRLTSRGLDHLRTALPAARITSLPADLGP